MEFAFSPSYNLYTLQGASQGSSGQYSAMLQGASQGYSGQCAMSPQLTGNDCPGMCMPRRGNADPQVVQSFSIKVINPIRKTEPKLFILRNIELQYFTQPETVQKLILDQLRSEVSNDHSFEFGYFQGNKRIWARNTDDLKEIQRLLKSKASHNVTLWCMGKSQSAPVKRTCVEMTDSDSGGESESLVKAKSKKKKTKYEGKLEREDDLVDKLKSKHGVTYTIIQYQVWAETMEAGRHDNLDSPPKDPFSSFKVTNVDQVQVQHLQARVQTLAWLQNS